MRLYPAKIIFFTFFFKKICIYQKIVVPLHRNSKTTYKHNKKNIYHVLQKLSNKNQPNSRKFRETDLWIQYVHTKNILEK